jgi:FkbM family methyltransferase
VTAVFNSVLVRGDVAIDVGANIGYFSLLAAERVGERGAIFAFEPDSRSRTQLAEHVQINGLLNVKVFPFGLAETDGQVTLHPGPSNNPGGASIRPGGSSTPTLIELRRGDHLIPRELWPRVRLIKIDVEGAEYRALLGFGDLIGTAQHVVIEVSPNLLEEMGHSESQLLAYMFDRGYSMRRVWEAPAGELWQYDALFTRPTRRGVTSQHKSSDRGARTSHPRDEPTDGQNKRIFASPSRPRRLPRPQRAAAARRSGLQQSVEGHVL